jgi:AraC-like DNA-binding protein
MPIVPQKSPLLWTRGVAARETLSYLDRSFTRQLAKEATTFGEILERLRQHLASRYLGDDRMSIKQIAWLLGYSEPGAFTHAYKRWTGTTPMRARQKQRPGLA